MSIYRGSLGEISNNADWLSPIIEFVDDDNDQGIDLSAATEILFEIRKANCRWAEVTANLENGKIILIEPSKFQVSIAKEELRKLCEGQYQANLSFTMDGLKHDPVLATITIVKGAGY